MLPQTRLQFSMLVLSSILVGQLTGTHANDTSSKRVFLLGPSHHLYLEKAALTKCTHYGTPLGNLPIDATTTAELHKTGQFDWMTQDVDEDEHSLEMHLPYIYKMLSK
jgi:AmmeMemoRadiSam system protein B